MSKTHASDKSNQSPVMSSFEIQELKDRVASLSMRSSSDASKELYDLMKAVPLDENDVVQKVESYDVLRPAVKQACLSLGNHLLEEYVNFNEQQIGHSNLAKMLHFQLFNGYKSSVEQLQEEPETNKNSLIAQAIHRSMSEAVELVLFQYQLYNEVPDDIWKQINWLYVLAEKLGLHDLLIEDPDAHITKNSSILQLMIRVQLLALSRPYNLRRSDLCLTNEALECWSSYVCLGKQEKDNALFQIDLSSNCCAGYIDKTSQGSSIRYINTNELIDKLLDDSQNKGIEQSHIIPNNMSSHLLSHLCSSWSKHLKRESYRAESSGKIEACIGFDAAYHHCAGQKSLAQITQELNLKKPAESSAEQPSSDFYELYPARVKNMGVGGLGLIWEQQIPPSINIGDFICTRFENTDNWLVGVISWVKVHSSKKIEMGVNLSSSEIDVGVIGVNQDEPEPASYKPAILLPTIDCSSSDTVILQDSFADEDVLVEACFATKKGRFQMQKTGGASKGFNLFYLHGINPKNSTSSVSS